MMAADTRITIVGAGGSFAIGLVHDLCLMPDLHGCTIVLMDIDPERLACALSLCNRHARDMGATFRFSATLSREEALQGADFVINIALHDGARRMRDGWAIARQHGIEFPGSYHILYDEPFWLNFYQLRFFESLTRDMLRICPQAWHLMVANPVLAGTTFLQRHYPEAKMVGLCHGFAEVYQIADILGLDRDALSFEIPGVNHFVWLTSLRCHGEDVFPRIDQWIQTESSEYWQSHTHGVFSPRKIDLYRRFGALPIGDTANWTGASWPWWQHGPLATGQDWKQDCETPWYDYIQGMASGAQTLRAIASDTDKPVAEHYHLGRTLTGEPMIPIVEAIARDKPRVVIGNILNTGEFIPGIPRDFEVEIPLLVSGRGIQGIQTNGLPRSILAWTLRDRVAPVNIELEAYVSGRREYLVELVLMDKWASSEDVASRFVDAILALPYHEEMRRHYR